MSLLAGTLLIVANRWRKLIGAIGAPFRRFDAAPRPIDQVILDMSGRVSSRRVSRSVALSVPAVLRGRNLICSISTLPLLQRAPDGSVRRLPLLQQIDPDVANVVTLAQTLEDLLFESIAWWEVITTDPQGYPTSARRRDPCTVSLEPPAGVPLKSPAPLPSGYDPRGAVVWVDGRPVPYSMIIRFDSPNPPVLSAGARAIRRAILLDAAASMYADDPRPLDYFTPTEGAEAASDDEIKVILDEWSAARKRRATAYVPRSLTYNAVTAPSPQQLQLVELQQQVNIELANALGVDPEDLGISTTSRTYANVIDRRRDKINDVLSLYMLAVTQRLSMGDVTKRGYTVDFDLDGYMRSNPTERWSTYTAARALMVISRDEIRAREGWGPMPQDLADEISAAEAAPSPDPTGLPAGDPAALDPAALNAAFADITHRFGAGDSLRFADIPVRGFRVDVPRRTITGLALPYGATASKYGFAIGFVPGALQWDAANPGRIKLLRDHNMSDPVGVATQLTETDAGLATQFRIARGPGGDAVLSLAADGVLDGLSVGVDFNELTDASMSEDGSTMMVHRADLREVSITAMPAFDDARVTTVTASRSSGGTMHCATCGQDHAQGVACSAPSTQQPANQGQPASPTTAGFALSPEQMTAILSAPGALQSLMGAASPATPQPQPAQQSGGLTLSADQVSALVRGGQLATLLGVPQVTQTQPVEPARPVVNPTRVTASVSVGEPLPYQFDRRGNLRRGTHDFSTDLVAASHGDKTAMERASSFMSAQFPTDVASAAATQFTDVDTTDIGALNPSRQRPDLYVDQKDYLYPIWDAINKGTLTDYVPFVLPKFSSSSGLVAAHVQGTEPTPGALAATSQTITPSAVSGIVTVTREAWEAGGNPQLSAILWRQMVRAWFEALEASAVTMLDALSPTALGTFTAGGGTTGQTLSLELEAALAALQYARGGFRFRDFFLQIDLYKALIGARDGDGRPLYPLIGVQNANGQGSDFFGDIMIGGLRGRPAWALAATSGSATSSYLFDRGDVHGWASTPNRLVFEYEVANVHVGIWGYKALANTDLTGIRELSFDPTA